MTKTLRKMIASRSVCNVRATVAAAMAGLMALALAAQALAVETPNPFEQGTVRVQLTDSERDNLMQYVNQSKAALEAALEEAKGRSLGDTARIYSRVIQKIVMESYAARPRAELLMRFILNQALELTYGVPNATGTRLVKPGILKDAVNTDLSTVILEDSIRLALHYVQSDFDAIRAQSPIDLPYIAMANTRLSLASTWADSVLEDAQGALFLDPFAPLAHDGGAGRRAPPGQACARDPHDRWFSQRRGGKR